MHIGLYSPAWPPSEFPNGVVTYVRTVRTELLRLGHRVSVFSGHCEPDDSERIYRVAVESRWRLWAALERRFGRGWNSEYDLGPRIAQSVMRVHVREPLDVFEMEESFGWCADVAAQTRVPLVVKLHGPAFLSSSRLYQSTAQHQLQVEVEGRAMRSVRAVVAPSRSTLMDTANQYPFDRDQLVCIPNPVDLVGHSLVWRPKARCADELLFVGRFDHQKGGDAVLRAFAKIAASRPRLQLTFAGPDGGIPLAGSGVQHFAEFVRTHLEPSIAARVRFMGTLPFGEIQRLRLEAAVTIVASRRESFGYAVAEAMTQGCPIVAFDVAGVNELIVDGDTGLLAPLDDIDALSARIERLLDCVNEAAALGARARIAIAASFGVQPVVGRMLELYKRVNCQRPSTLETTRSFN